MQPMRRLKKRHEGPLSQASARTSRSSTATSTRCRSPIYSRRKCASRWWEERSSSARRADGVQPQFFQKIAKARIVSHKLELRRDIEKCDVRMSRVGLLEIGQRRLTIKQESVQSSLRPRVVFASHHGVAQDQLHGTPETDRGRFCLNS